jgi:hypothetical protein
VAIKILDNFVLSIAGLRFLHRIQEAYATRTEYRLPLGVPTQRLRSPWSRRSPLVRLIDAAHQRGLYPKRRDGHHKKTLFGRVRRCRGRRRIATATTGGGRIASTRSISSIFLELHPAAGRASQKLRGRRGRQLRRRATVLGLRSVRRDHLAGLVDTVFGHAVMEDRAETEIPSRLDS